MTHDMTHDKCSKKICIGFLEIQQWFTFRNRSFRGRPICISVAFQIRQVGFLRRVIWRKKGKKSEGIHKNFTSLVISNSSYPTFLDSVWRFWSGWWVNTNFCRQSVLPGSSHVFPVFPSHGTPKSTSKASRKRSKCSIIRCCNTGNSTSGLDESVDQLPMAGFCPLEQLAGDRFLHKHVAKEC